MLGVIKNFVEKVIVRLNAPSLHKLEQQNRRFEQHEVMIQGLVEANFRTRAMLKRAQKLPIHVLFVCHTPTLWSMFESVYKAAADDPNFSVSVVALPYRHISLPEGKYKDEGVFEYLHGKNINVIQGYDPEKDEWLNPIFLSPDYIFYQTPYHIFPDIWSVERLSKLARVCYFSYYGTCLFSGEVEKIVHPDSFFKCVHLFFMENEFSMKIFEDMFCQAKWYKAEHILLTGHPKMDSLLNRMNSNEISWDIWKRRKQKNIKRILWTPRWYTSEGTCHFFDYRDYFLDFCENNQSVDFVFRPHPLCLQNFIKTGELSAYDLLLMETEYEKSINMALDRSGEYFDAFLTSDVLISDTSSMLLEFFVTGKPIIYTHRVDVFNAFGKKLSAGFYWVNNSDELNKTLEMLLSGQDPLKAKREALIDSLLFVPEGGAGLMVTNNLRTDFDCFS